MFTHVGEVQGNRCWSGARCALLFLQSTSIDNNVIVLIRQTYLGPNAIRVLRELGVWEDVLAASGEAELNMSVFRYISGLHDHEMFYDVCLTWSIRPLQWQMLIIYQNALRNEDHGLGIARSALVFYP